MPVGEQEATEKKKLTGIFISYRRSDTPDAVGRIYDRLVAEFGKARVFKDVKGISMRLQSYLLVCVLAACVACSGGRSAPLSEEQGHQVATTMLDGIVESFNREDGEAYGANYWPDAELVGFDGTILDGRDAIIRNHVDMWAGPLKDAKIRGLLRKVRVLGPDALVVDVDLVRESTPATGPARVKFVMERREGTWKIAAAQNTLTSTSAP